MDKTKNILPILLVLLLVMTFGNASSVTGRGNSQAGATTYQLSSNDQKTGNSAQTQTQTQMQEFARIREQVRINNQEIARVKKQILDSCEELKLRIQTRLQNRDQITANDMDQYQEAKQLISRNREQLRLEYQGKLQEQVALMNQARVRGDLNAAIKTMTELQTRQETRLDRLNKLLASLQSIRNNL